MPSGFSLEKGGALGGASRQGTRQGWGQCVSAGVGHGAKSGSFGGWCRHRAMSSLRSQSCRFPLGDRLSPLRDQLLWGWGGEPCPLEVPQHVHAWGACAPEAVQVRGNCSVLRLRCLDFNPPLSFPPSPTLGSLTLAWLLIFSGSHCKMEPHNGISLLKLL